MSTATPTHTGATTNPDHLYVCADTTPGVHRTDSDDAATGTGAIFDSCECALWGVR